MVDHIQNRKELIDFIKADTVGPLTNIEQLNFEPLDLTKKIIFKTREDANKLFRDSNTGEEILHMNDWQYNPLKSYSAGILYPLESIMDTDNENDEVDTDRKEEMLDIEEIENTDQIKLLEKQEKILGRKNSIEDGQSSDIDINGVNQRKPSAIAMSFHFECTKDTELEINFSGGIYEPIPVYETNIESKKNIRNLIVPSDDIPEIDMSTSNTWWVSCKTSFDFTMKLQKLFAPNDNYWHHKNLEEMKPGDIVLIYSKQTVKAIAIVTEESKLEENIYENLSEEVLAGSAYKTKGEYITVKIKTFELSIPININDISKQIKEEVGSRKYSTFTKDGVVNTHYASKLDEIFITYLKEELKAHWPINCPWGVKFDNSETFSYSKDSENKELSDEALWKGISSFESQFEFEDLKNLLSENLSFDDEILKKWLEKLVASKELIYENDFYRIENKLSHLRTFFARKKFEESLIIASERITQISERGYIPPKEPGEFETSFYGLDLKYSVFIRKYGKSYIGTVVLENMTKSFGKDSECALFQAKILLKVTNGKNSQLLTYPSGKQSVEPNEYIEQEDKTFEMLYSDNPVYAVGHGTSVGWVDSSEIYTETVPTIKLDNLTPDIKDSRTGNDFNIGMLELHDSENYSLLEELLDQYETWIQELEVNKDKINTHYQDVAGLNIDNCKLALSRMRLGLETISKNEKAKKAFQLANLAMHKQQIRPDETQLRKIIEFNPQSEKDKRVVFDKQVAEKEFTPKWRPFQIAFFLLNIESIVNKNSEDRENVELLWFPTGGGKTEAYLGISAFTLFYQRLDDSKNTGTTILMRYTLRLLTAQQFERASKLICSMEVIRHENHEILGETRFTIAIWVGGNTSPNTKKQAIQNLNDIKNPNSYKSSLFILQQCPWCAAEMGTNNFTKSDRFIAGVKKDGDTVSLSCPDLSCDFNKSLPVFVIDEDIYEKTPSFIVATVDKFARVSWRPDSRGIFGINKDGERINKPPSLIIQDELHLISNALGSSVGFFETILEELCIDFRESTQIKPKIICSTATIRNSRRQILGLYARNKSSIFPPSGLTIDDSFFSKKDTSVEGKVYLGLFTPGITTQQTQTNLYSATSQAMSLFEDKESKDPWITNLCYFGSMRELGTTYSLLSENIVRQLRFLHDKYQIATEDKVYAPYQDQVMELTSRLDSSDVVSTMQKLNQPLMDTEEKFITKFVLATSIIEVGIDIQRLSLMTILNQPKNTSQYIQTSGRVGRNKNKPGLIITIFSPMRPRDRSHYEKFKAYHQKLHSQVEPTSVTPFSDAAIRRMLHGAFFMYLGAYMPQIYFRDPQLEFPFEKFERFKKLILERNVLVTSEQENNQKLENYLNDIPNIWNNVQADIYEDEMDNDIDSRPLIMQASSWRKHITPSFLIPNSLRSVDGTARGEIITPPYVEEG